MKEYMLGDPGYIGEETFIFLRIDNRELRNTEIYLIVSSINIRNASRRAKMELR